MARINDIPFPIFTSLRTRRLLSMTAKPKTVWQFCEPMILTVFTNSWSKPGTATIPAIHCSMTIFLSCRADRCPLWRTILRPQNAGKGSRVYQSWFSERVDQNAFVFERRFGIDFMVGTDGAGKRLQFQP